MKDILRTQTHYEKLKLQRNRMKPEPWLAQHSDPGTVISTKEVTSSKLTVIRI